MLAVVLTLPSNKQTRLKSTPYNSRYLLYLRFKNLGIKCVRKKEIDLSLKIRLQQNVNPFNVPIVENDPDIDLNVVRLCFEAFLPDENNCYSIPLRPVVSLEIFDKSKRKFECFVCWCLHIVL